MGIRSQPDKANLIDRQGALKYRTWTAHSGLTISFINNLMASAKGCNSPLNVTLFGPFRACLNPKIFRSRRVKKATFNNTGIRIHKVADVDLKILS